MQMDNTVSSNVDSSAPDGMNVLLPREEQIALDSLREWILERMGLHFGDNKQLNLYRRLSSLCWRLGIPDLKSLERHLAERDMPNLDSELATAVSTSHSFFNREPEVLQFIQEKIFPTLPPNNEWRIWSAAAASGEEAYSVAILLADSLGVIPAQSKVTILGTDISYPMIEAAEKGMYPTQRIEFVDDRTRKAYFTPVGPDQWRIHPALMKMCTFRRMNLKSHPWPFQNGFHVVLCRNVLYYFDRERQEELIERIYDATLPGGWLITSVTETLSRIQTRWTRVTSGVYRK
jgi:chemotaxis protein methyltransferase CheR